MILKNFDEVINRVGKLPKRKRCAIVAADEASITASLAAEEKGLATPVFIGERRNIEVILEQLNAKKAYEIYDIPDSAEAALLGVRLARNKDVDFIIKGHIETSALLKAVVNKEEGLGIGKLMSHIAFNEISTYHKLLITTDGGMNLYPDVNQKQMIIENSVDILKKLGYDEPKIACLAAVEKVNPKMPESVDAEELKRRNQDGIIKGCIIEGPISFDIAYCREAAKLKNYESLIAGDADVLLVPNITVGNVLGKSLVYAAGGKMAGFVVGAQCPIILTSRSSTAEEKFLSTALASLIDQ
ncbi:Phosphate butyryltransferase [Tepidanaerobacter acetatoxydans Re1]|uniref:Phosphate butyryltransferase n=1 Tax=Tepidanaerobacter acetatoxydans (strain DSM 21804 / JCM 16047 / Re1) TaxID=1209989 RepID=F4LS11_TEPAE|nr:phosphate acyltransferase [Tepidanaerobacter acetatoxydans]AEE92350.1 Phosphate butyryltransferase [Tepidanaerobacter acetatoxydans Re1]CCP27238.1 Phosphate butyryltransferase [Tepidanaerobacter acetatoxydans Re1]